MGHVVLKELGQSTIFVLTEFIVSSSPPLCLVGYHVHLIYILSQAVAVICFSSSPAAEEQWPEKTQTVKVQRIDSRGLVG